uniref:Ig-like domain-containing protein n=1 Tax=Anabas testudineus TaxID=64144 RepID=A0A3Q1J6W4_ANATE
MWLFILSGFITWTGKPVFRRARGYSAVYSESQWPTPSVSNCIQLISFTLVLSLLLFSRYRCVAAIFILGNAEDVPCPIQMTPPAIVVKFGDAFSVNCTSLASKTEGIGWESSAGGTVTLNFTRSFQAKQTDEGICLSVLLLSTEMMDSVSLSLPSDTGPMVEGKKYRMQCDVANVAPASHLTVYWHKGNSIIHTETFNESSITPVSKLSIYELTAHRDDDGAQIWCEAKLNFLQSGLDLRSMQTRSHKMTVLYTPTFSQPANVTVEITAQSQLILNCTARGNPVPVYNWQFPHTTTQTAENQIENQPTFKPSFPLPGTYICTATNSQGTRDKYFTVIQDTGNRTTFVAIVAVFAILGVLLAAAGLFFVTPNGTFSFNRCSYQPTSSGPV